METIWGPIAVVLGAIVLIYNAYCAIRESIRPTINTRKEIEKHAERLDELEEREKQDSDALEHLEKMSKLQCQCMICLINHMIDGNGVEEMKKTRDKVQELIVDL